MRLRLGKGWGYLRKRWVWERDGVREVMGVLTEVLGLGKDGVRGGMGELTEVTSTHDVIAHH